MKRETYLLLLSFRERKFPKIFIPKVFKVLADSIDMIVLTHSNKTAFPVFLAFEVLVATYAKIS